MGWAAAALVLYALIGFLLAPPLVRYKLERALREQLGRQVTVESVRINPFALSASVRGLAVKERDGSANAAGFEDLSVDVTLLSLLRGGVVVEAVSLTKPYFRIVRFEDGQ